MLLLTALKAKTMEELITKCNMLVIKGGISYDFKIVTDGKQFYATYFVDTENSELIRKVSALGRRNTTKK